MIERYVEGWKDSILNTHHLSIASEVSTTGEINQPLGGRWRVAKIEVLVEPAPSFCVSCEMEEPLTRQMEREGFLEHAVYGMIDILATAQLSPVLRLRIRFVGAAIHPVESTPVAFRLAGRDAARRILDQAKIVP